MKINKLTLTNFGLFRGEQIIDFSASSDTKPIILIGGRNGRGKTTLLSAFQLVLFGERAQCLQDSSAKYKEQMSQFIHRAPGIESCSVCLDFSRWADGKESTYSVEREWRSKEGDIDESLRVSKDGKHDEYLTNTWREVVEDILPLEISGLFFFDGEKIEAFANPTKSRRLLSAAIGALLGLNDVERLQKDLIILERTKRKELATEGDFQVLEELEGRLKIAEKERAAAEEKLGRKRETLDLCRQAYAAAEDAYRMGGAELYETREQVFKESNRLQGELREIDDQLRYLAESEAPLLLLRPQLEELAGRAREEAEVRRNRLLVDLLADRDEQLLEYVNDKGLPNNLMEAVKRFLASDRDNRRVVSSFNSELCVTDEGIEQLSELLNAGLPKTDELVRGLLHKRDQTDAELIDVNRRMLAIPAKEFIVDLIKDRDRALEEMNKTTKSCEELELELKAVETHKEAAESAWQKALERLTEQKVEHEETLRIIEHAALVRSTMRQFAKEVTGHHAQRIAALVLDSFQRLLAKKNFVKGLRIDPESFAVLIEEQNGDVIYPEKLSAGERQLLAVAMLWGLARASGFPLPVIIDTPLGRLDGQHRTNLAKEYFPSASHQVILLSHDEEIIGELLGEIKPRVSSSFLFEYIEGENRTEVRRGYFV